MNLYCLNHPQRAQRVCLPVCHWDITILYSKIEDRFLLLMVKHHHHCLLYVMYVAIWIVKSVLVSPTISSDLQRTPTILHLNNASFLSPTCLQGASVNHSHAFYIWFLYIRFFFIYNFICLFLTVLGLHCCAGFSLVVESGGYSPVAVHRLLITVACLVAVHSL